jgi:hypothetical protein
MGTSDERKVCAGCGNFEREQRKDAMPHPDPEIATKEPKEHKDIHHR